MAEYRASMMSPPIESLLSQVDSKFTLVTVAARRARQVNSYFNHLGEGLGSLVPPQVASRSRKPLSIALDEVAGGKISYTRPDPAAELAAAELAAAEEAAAQEAVAQEAVADAADPADAN